MSFFDKYHHPLWTGRNEAASSTPWSRFWQRQGWNDGLWRLVCYCSLSSNREKSTQDLEIVEQGRKERKDTSLCIYFLRQQERLPGKFVGKVGLTSLR